MSRAPSVNQAARTVEAAIEGERLGVKAVERVSDGCSDPDLLMRAVLQAQALDGIMAPAGPALRAAMRQVQKALEVASASA